MANRVLLVESDVVDNVIPYIFPKNFNGEIAYKGNDHEECHVKMHFSDLATGVIRFLLRDAKDSSKSLILQDENLQQIVVNSNTMHSGLQCKFLHFNRYIILHRNGVFFSFS